MSFQIAVDKKGLHFSDAKLDTHTHTVEKALIVQGHYVEDMYNIRNSIVSASFIL